MKAGIWRSLACLGGVCVAMTVVGTSHQAWAISKDAAAALATMEKTETNMAAIPALKGMPIPPDKLKKVMEPTEEMAIIPGRADEKPFIPFRKAAPAPEKKMAIIPAEAGNDALGKAPATKAP